MDIAWLTSSLSGSIGLYWIRKLPFGLKLYTILSHLLSVLVTRLVAFQLHLHTYISLVVTVTLGSRLRDGDEADDESDSDGDDHANPRKLSDNLVYRLPQVLQYAKHAPKHQYKSLLCVEIL